MFNNLIQVYKPIGETPLETLKRYALENNIKDKIAYSGRLDPMAHGNLLLMIGNETKNSEKYNKYSKKYRFKILFGIETDTTDVLGIVNNYKFNVQLDNLDNILKQFNNYTYEQEYHIFSSMTCKDDKGKKVPLWSISKNGKIPQNIPKKLVHIHKLDVKSTLEPLKGDKVKEIINENLSKITSSGDFRLENIKKSWNDFFNTDDSIIVQYPFIELEASVSSGTYIRQLTKDIGNLLNVPVMVIELYRYPLEF